MTKRLLTTQKIVNLSSDPISGVSGEYYYNTTTNEIRLHNGISWNPIGGGGASVTISSIPPSGASEGDLWINDETLSLFVYYDSSWVEVGNGSGSGGINIDGGTPSSVYGGTNPLNGGTP